MSQQQPLQKSDSTPVSAWGMKSTNSRGRRHDEPEHPYRTVFQRDRDRIIHSTAFRRLQYKTQVFVIHEGDYYRTRLTHTQEVSQLSRTIARALGLNGDLTEAISLAHDLGHTPFGHSGEDALNQCLQDAANTRFRHNRQSLRIIERLEDRYPSFRGLNASWELRESVIKHGFPDHPTPPDRYDPDSAPLLEERVVDVTDAVAYTNHDLDDGLKSGILSRDQLRNVSLWREAVSVVRDEHGEQPRDRERSQIIRYLLDKMVSDLIETTRKRLKEHNIHTVEDVRNAHHRLVCFSPDLLNEKQDLSDFLHEKMYCHHRVIRMQERAKRIVRELFEEYMRCPKLLPESYQEWMDSAGKPRAIADYIAGMTDRYAIQEHQELFGKGP